MDKKMVFINKSFDQIKNKIENFKKGEVFCFLNSHSIYFFKNNDAYRNSVLNSTNSIDGISIALFFSLLKMKRISRLKGPNFTKAFFSDKELNVNGKHFFIGLNKEDLDKLSLYYPNLNRSRLYSYNPPYIKEYAFSKKEINKMAKLIKIVKPNYVWVSVGSPKQEILSYSLSKMTRNSLFFNVGAALDFILKKKKEAPSVLSKLGLEWLFRLVSDFRYSKKKVWLSLIGTMSIPFSVRIE